MTLTEDEIRRAEDAEANRQAEEGYAQLMRERKASRTLPYGAIMEVAAIEEIPGVKSHIGPLPEAKPRPHTASRMNPVDALAQAGRESRRAYERDWHIWTEAEIDDWTVRWDVPRTVAEAFLNFQQEEEAACRHVHMVNLGGLARWAERYAQERRLEGQMAERDRYWTGGD